MQNFFRVKMQYKNLGYLRHQKKLPKEIPNHPIGENSPNMVRLGEFLQIGDM
jgi:hypothetical protein